MRLPVLIFGVVGCIACKSGEDRYATVTRDQRPVVENVPAPLSRCKGKVQPQASWHGAAGAPVAGEIVRAYHACLGAHAVLIRLKSQTRRPVTQVVLEREFADINGRRPPRRDRQPLKHGFARGTVRYVRITWREGLENPGERLLRVRLQAAWFQDGSRWQAPPWPASPAPTGDNATMAPDAPLQQFRKLGEPARKMTRQLRRFRQMQESKTR